ncbi:MAG: DUF4153 domain-containing protein, partial [Pedobacter sp.]
MKFKLPSIHTLWAGVTGVATRFPLQVLVALSCTAVWCFATGKLVQPETFDELVKVIVIGNLALTLLLSGDLYAEVSGISGARKWAIRLFALLFCVGLYFWLQPSVYGADAYRLALLAFSFHLLVAFAPFVGRGSLNGFWEYNKTLFLRFLAAALYAAVLFGGLSAALAAVDSLFSIKIDWVVYVRLFAIVVAGFSTIFFLAGVPVIVPLTADEVNYPKGLKIFTQYVLIPLMTIYLAILLVYEVKIVVSWEFPKGMVSLLVLGYAVFGILSLLLIYPIREKEGNGWIKLFSRFFYFMMIPLVVLLLLAVWKRVSDYGITEPRYILICLAIWLTMITVYFLTSKQQNIKAIPGSLCILALLAVYGPQSAFTVSRYSQVSRLKKLTKEKAKDEDKAGVIRYLVQKHGLDALQDFTQVNLAELEDKMLDSIGNKRLYSVRYELIDTALAILKVGHEKAAVSEYVQFVRGAEAAKVAGYQYMVPVDSYDDKTEATVKGVALVLEKDLRKRLLKVYVAGKLAVEFDFNERVSQLKAMYKQGKLKVKEGAYETYYLPNNMVAVNLSHENYQFTFVFTNVS